MPSAFLKDLHLKRSPLLEHILRFNLRPGEDVHLDRLPPSLKTARSFLLPLSVRGRRRFSRLVEACKGFSTESFFDFQEPRRRLALLDGPTLDRLATFTGAAACHSALTKCVLGPLVRRLQERLGRDVHAFAVGPAAVLVGTVPQIAPLHLDDPEVDPALEIRNLGLAWMARSLDAEPSLLWDRLEQKLTPVADHRGNGPGTAPCAHPSRHYPGISAITKDQAWRLVSRVLLRKVEPRWVPCFA